MREIAKFIYEVGSLKEIARSGWWLAGIKYPESVAEHSFRVIVIGYILAKLENVDLERVLGMCMLQDLCESRITDLNKVAQRYIDAKTVESKAFKELVKDLPEILKKEFLELFKEYSEQKSSEAILARDADLLENAFQAVEYLERGYKDAEDWITNIGKLLKSDSAKEIYNALLRVKPNEWWKGLKKIER